MTELHLTAIVLVLNLAIWLIIGYDKKRFLICLLLPIAAFAITQLFPVLDSRFDRNGMTFLFFISIVPPILNYWMHRDHAKMDKQNKAGSEQFVQLFNYFKFLFVNHITFAAATVIQLFVIWSTSLVN